MFWHIDRTWRRTVSLKGPNRCTSNFKQTPDSNVEAMGKLWRPVSYEESPLNTIFPFLCDLSAFRGTPCILHAARSIWKTIHLGYTWKVYGILTTDNTAYFQRRLLIPFLVENVTRWQLGYRGTHIHGIFLISKTRLPACRRTGWRDLSVFHHTPRCEVGKKVWRKKLHLLRYV